MSDPGMLYMMISMYCNKRIVHDIAITIYLCTLTPATMDTLINNTHWWAWTMNLLKVQVEREILDI